MLYKCVIANYHHDYHNIIMIIDDVCAFNNCYIIDDYNIESWPFCCCCLKNMKKKKKKKKKKKGYMKIINDLNIIIIDLKH